MRRYSLLVLFSLGLWLMSLPLAAQDNKATPAPEATAETTAEAEGTPDVFVPPAAQEDDDPRAITCRTGEDAFIWHLEEAGRRRGRVQNYEAYQHYNCAVQLDPYAWIAYRGRAITLSAQNNFQGALADLDVALDLAPKEATLYYWRATVLMQMGELDPALKALNRSIELDPGYAYAFNLRGLIHRDLDLPDLAIQDFQIALTIGMPDQPHVPYVNLGHLYLDKLNNRVEAMHWYQEATIVSPGNSALYELLGDNHLALNQLEEAEKNYKIYVDLENNAKESVLAVVEVARLRQLALRYAPSLVIVAIMLYFAVYALWTTYRKRRRPLAAAPAEAAPVILSAATPIPDDYAVPVPASPDALSAAPRRNVTALVLVPVLAGAAYLLRRFAQPVTDE
jgi:tetratricopeptide (TPR) repeat protein